MLASVVIPTFNSANTLYYTLSSLFKNKFPKNSFEVIIVDYRSIDSTLKIAEKFPVRMFSIKNKGSATARNFGISQADGEIICFTDSDCIVPNDWLSKISTFFENNPETEGVGGPLLPYTPINKIQKCAGEILLERLCFPDKITKIQPRVSHLFLLTANCAFKKESLKLSYNFDDSFGTSLEDKDLIMGLVDKGNHIIFHPEIKMFHIFPHTLIGFFKHYIRYGIGTSKIGRKYQNYVRIYPKKYVDYRLSFLFVISPRCSNRTLEALRCCQKISYNLGLLYGSIKEGYTLRRVYESLKRSINQG